MKNIKNRFFNLIISSIVVTIIINIVIPYVADAIIYQGAGTIVDGTYVVRYGKQMKLDDDETAKSSNSNICKIEGKDVKIVGTGAFTIKSNKKLETENYFAWNVKINRGTYYYYDNANVQGSPAGSITAPCYLSAEISSDGKSLKIKDAIGGNSAEAKNKYITNYYDKQTNKSRSVYFEYGFSEKESEPGTGDPGTEYPGDDTVLKVHFIDPQGRADAIYVEYGDVNFFFDGGMEGYAKVEKAYLDKIGVKQIDYYIGTHSHRDHVGAATDIINAYNIPNIIVNGAKSYRKYVVLTAILSYGTPQLIENAKKCKVIIVNHGDDLNKKLGLEDLPLKIKCVGPIGYENHSRGDPAQNNNSMVLNFTYNKISFLFTGDLDNSTKLKQVIDAYPDLCKVTVLKNAHHNGSQTQELYQRFGMKYVVFCTNSEKLPKAKTLNAIKNLGAESFIVTPNKNKNVLMTTDGNTIKVKTNV